MAASGTGEDPAIVVLGGGTGLSVLLAGLKEHTSDITAVVSVADDGGSSGRLRSELGVPPPGDIRNCLVALADEETLLGEVFQYRFEEGSLAGHSLGNLIIAALADMTGDFVKAVDEAAGMLGSCGRVLPASRDEVILKAELASGEVVRGQAAIIDALGPCRRVWLEPGEARAPVAVIEAIRRADMAVIGPGSLFTSIIPNLLIEDIAEALTTAGCPRVFICNIMTQPGETDGFMASDHLAAVFGHVKRDIIDAIIVNEAIPPAEVMERFRQDGPEPVRAEAGRLAEMGVEAHFADVASVDDCRRHDRRKLAAAVVSLLDSRNCHSLSQ